MSLIIGGIWDGVRMITCPRIAASPPFWASTTPEPLISTIQQKQMETTSTNCSKQCLEQRQSRTSQSTQPALEHIPRYFVFY